MKKYIASAIFGLTAVMAFADCPTVLPTPAPVVQPAPTGCSATGYKMTLDGSYASDTASIRSNGFVSYKLPIYTTTNIPAGTKVGSITIPGTLATQFTGVQNNVDASTSPRWGVQFAVSPCVGDFTSMAANCTAWGIPDNGGIVLRAYPAASQSGNNCTTQFGKQYFLNVRFIDNTKLKPTCPNTLCTVIINFNSSAKLN